MKQILIFYFLILNWLNLSKSQYPDDCSFNANKNNYVINCIGLHHIPENFSLSGLTHSTINLKLVAKENVKLLGNKAFRQLDLISLDVSGNQDKMESEAMSSINSFNQLVLLNMSYNQISIIRTNQFKKLKKLISLDLSYNQIFYFK